MIRMPSVDVVDDCNYGFVSRKHVEGFRLKWRNIFARCYHVPMLRNDALNKPCVDVEFTHEEAEALGAFEETALSEDDAREATEETTE